MSSMSPAVMQALGAFMATLPDDVNNQGKQAMQQQAVEQQAAQGGPVAQGAQLPQGGQQLNPVDELLDSQLGATSAASRARGIVDQGTRGIGAEIDDQTGHELSAARIKAAEDARVAEAQANPWRGLMVEVDDLQSKHKQAQAMGEKNAMKAYDNYLRSVDDFSQQRVYNWWGEAGTGAKVLGVLSQMFAGAAQGLSGQSGPTPLDRVIEQDLQLQKMGLDKKGQDVANTRGVYSDLKAQLKDESAAYGAALEIAYTSTLRRAEIIVHANPTAANQAALAQLEQHIMAKRAAMRQERYADYVKNGMTQAMQEAGVATQWGGLWNDRLTNDQQALLKAQAGIKGGVAGVAGSEYLDPTPKADLGKAVGNGKAAIATLGKMGSLLAERQAGRLGLADYQTGLKQELATFQGAMKDVLGLGALSGPDQTLLEDLAGVNGKWLENLGPGKSLDNLAQRLNRAQKIVRTLVLSKAAGLSVGGQALQVQDPDFQDK